ncbi:hypothetical protein AB733_11930 [Photobacterium swingsii]|uniref:Uncharacterized protein n=1 Tax=Photobacterium swingsii TaxID=680026 RepID=A0A0J8VAR3_9GAMM|nr:HNH endonuclease domain-containing protein [Photobacterium swingsii]KMV30376.1 hypothetical protein AB733_11930 [Photobacterium swingsii]PSW24453.1 hypothetical protein C9I94_10460 [Photobacterium swingsii]
MVDNPIKKKEIKAFLDSDSTALNTFRTLTLFGRNSATYKFALCHSLMQQSAICELKYEDVQEIFLKELVRHYRKNNHQFAKKENAFTHSIDQYLNTEQSEADWQKLNKTAGKYIFNDVFRAFQNVGSGTIDKEYLLFEDVRKDKRIVLTDNLVEILESENLKKLINQENQARWRVIEEAWKAELSPNLLQYNDTDGLFYSVTASERIGLRSAVDTLLPYQNGRCFYCNRKVSKFVMNHSDDFPDVDHFFPFSIMKHLGCDYPSVNGVWNLVIACRECNRGSDGKFDAPPQSEFYTKLLERNILFFEEHKHSLKNSICLSLRVQTKLQIVNKMNTIYKHFKPIKGWQPKYTYASEDV